MIASQNLHYLCKLELLKVTLVEYVLEIDKIKLC